ncbi:MAG: endonuclease/exonuclease/phosphatase family protein [Thermoguttaceae bacterium]|nr:endonuclease/exonuclease/phosphatase family protein [Thermoguttaceae bacterium]
MKKVLVFLAVLVFLCADLSAAELKIMSYNIRNGKLLTGTEIVLEEPAKIVLGVDPDIAGIQEMDWHATRSDQRDIPEEFGKLCKMKSYFAPAIDFQGGKYGVGTLTKAEPIRAYNIPLPGKEEQRTLQVLEFEDYVFFCTHFSLTAASQAESVPIINAEAKKFTGKPIFIVGDFNAYPNSTTIQEMQKTWRILTPDEYTFPASDPTIRIDYVMTWKETGANVEVLEAEVVDAPSQSDHRPIYVKVKF